MNESSISLKQRMNNFSKDLFTEIYHVLDPFTDLFFYGFFFGILAISALLYRNYGMSFMLDPSKGQVHIISLDLMCFMALLGYLLLGKYSLQNGKRVFLALGFAWMSFYFHDMIWVVDTYFTGCLLTNGEFVRIGLQQVLDYLSRNLIYVGLPLYFLRSYLKPTKLFLLAFIPLILLNSYNILYHDYDYSHGVKLLAWQIVNMLPYPTLLLKKKA